MVLRSIFVDDTASRRCFRPFFGISQEELGYDSESESPPENRSNPLIELGLYENYLSNNPNYSSFDNYNSYAQHEKYRKYFDKKHFFKIM